MSFAYATFNTPSVPFYMMLFDCALSLRKKERKTSKICSLKQIIYSCMTINHPIKGKMKTLQVLNIKMCHSSCTKC